MSKLVKGVKKAFKGVTKVVKKVVKSKIFKVALMAAAVYFGGAALISMANGGTAMAGIGSAWSGVTGAGSALMSGQFSAAGSSISAGWSGAATGAQSFAAGKAATSAITTAAAAPATTTVAATSSGVGASTPQLAAMHPATASASMTPVATGSTASTLPSGGLLSGVWNGLGEAGKAAAISSAVNVGGQMVAGHAAEKASEEQEDRFRKRQTYWGVDGDGKGDTSGTQFKGLLQLAQVTPMSNGRAGTAPWNNPAPQPGVTTTPQASYQPKTLDELIKMMG